jgi:2-amino-4-hydroxy-6-hydroxymethyldihydropteridine diphosphokinase
VKKQYTPAVLAVGGNLGDRVANIRASVEALSETEGIKVRGVSPLVESYAVTEAGVDESKPNYINAVVKVDTKLKPKKLLREVRRIESQLGRVRIERWGSRTMDIDIVTYGDVIKSKKKLELPHPRAFQRSFVLVPWMMLDANAVLPGHGSIAELLKHIENDVWVVEQ